MPAEVYNLAHEWGGWCRSRRLLAPNDRLHSTLWRLVKVPRATSSDGPRVRLSAECSAFHLAVRSCDPVEQDMLMAYFVWKAKPVKLVAEAMAMSRTHFYRRLADAAGRAYRVHFEVLRANGVDR